jgi:hypothetical protein
MTIKVFAIAGAAAMALGVSACATQPHSDETMLSGSHSMPPKGAYMADKAMPAWSGDCSKAALEKMPPEHRAMCEKQAAPKP